MSEHVEDLLARDAALVDADMADFDEPAFLDRVYRSLGIDAEPEGPTVVHVQVVLRMGGESFAVAEADLTEDAYREQLVDLLRAAATELEDG